MSGPVHFFSVPPCLCGKTPAKRFIPSFVKLYRMNKFARISLYCAGGLALLVAFFYAEEDLRGWLTWKTYRNELEAKGIKLDFKDFVPKTVADEENFAATPLITSFFANGNAPVPWSGNYLKAMEKVTSLQQKNEKSKKGVRNFVDLTAWETAFDITQPAKPAWEQAFEKNNTPRDPRAKSALSVLEGLRLDEPVVTELREASKRPYARYPVVYNLDNPAMILLPHLAKLKAVIQHLQLRACSELAAGQNDKALDDVKLMFYVSDSLKSEPFLISYLVRIACMQLTLQPVWEGLAEHRWSDAQIQQLQSQLEQYDFAADLKLPMDFEQASGLVFVEILKKQGLGEFQKIISGDQPRSQGELLLTQLFNLAVMAVPRGWYYMEQVNFCKLQQEQIGIIFSGIKKDPLSSRNKIKTPELNRFHSYNTFERIAHHCVISSVLMPTLENLSIKPASAQTAVNEAALACALERYRLANGKFPENLESLASNYISQLPNDVVTGEPYKYRPLESSFLLYSIGWNKRDDGGVPGKILFDAKQGDWIWQYPEK